MTKLAELQVLALDCQATGANPSKGHLLEIAWVPSRAAQPGPVIASVPQSYLVRLPDNAAVPRAVQRITGISDQSLAAALPSHAIWQHLLSAAGAIAEANHAAACPCPLVIHFARFETPFLKDLYRKHGEAGAFPFRIICTHEIAVRLLPDLPRRGIELWPAITVTHAGTQTQRLTMPLPPPLSGKKWSNCCMPYRRHFQSETVDRLAGIHPAGRALRADISHESASSAAFAGQTRHLSHVAKQRGFAVHRQGQIS